MTECRLLSTVPVAAGQAIVINHGGDSAVALVGGAYAAGDYYFRDDGTADDLCLMISTRIHDVIGGSWECYINGVDVRAIGGVNGTACTGRLVIYHDSAFTIRSTQAAFSFYPRTMGFSTAADVDAVNVLPGLFQATAPWVHRYGWYPQDVAMRDLVHRVTDTSASFSSDRRRSIVDWTRGTSETDGEYQAIELEFDSVHRALVRRDALNAAAATEDRLTLGDLNCSFERFALDCSRSIDCDRQWYYYPDTVLGGRSGPFVWPADDGRWQDPLSGWMVREPAGERWGGSINGSEAIT